MNSPSQLYVGREQTYIKHAFLRRYLETGLAGRTNQGDENGERL